jgi:hypothetical protein
MALSQSTGAFNPAYQDTQPGEYLRWSRPIQGIEPDRSKEIALKGLGEGFDKAVNVADDLLDKSVKFQTRNEIEPIQDEYNRELTSTQTQLAQNQSKTATDLDLLSSDGAPSKPIPPTLQGFHQQVSNLVDARSNGKMTETMYYAQLNSKLKALRSQYPAHTDLIDRTVSNITGVNPANAEIRSRIADINAQVAASKEKTSKVENELWSVKGNPGWQAIYDQKGTPGWEQRAAKYINDVSSFKVGLENKALALRVDNEENANFDRRVEQAGTGIGQDYLSTHFSIRSDVSGKSPEQVLKAINDRETAPKTQEEMDAALQSWRQQREEARTGLLNVYRSTKVEADRQGPDGSTIPGRTFADILGPEKLAASVDKNISVAYDGIEKLMKDKEEGLAYNTHKQLEQAKDKNMWTIMGPQPTPQQQIIANKLGMIQALKEMGATIASGAMDQQLVQKGDNGAPSAIQVLQGWSAYNAATQTYSNLDGSPYTATDAVNAAGANGADPKSFPKTYRNLLDNSSAILNPNLPAQARINLMKYTFDPKNNGLISKVDEKGQYPLWNNLTSPAMIREATKLSKVSPEGQKAFENMQSWMENTFQNELYHSEITKLDKEHMDRPNIKLVYHDDTHSFEAVFKSEDGKRTYSTHGGVAALQKLQDRIGAHADQTRLSVLKPIIDKLNAGLQPFANLATTTRKDPDAYILGLVTNANTEETPMGEAITKAIAASRGK